MPRSQRSVVPDWHEHTLTSWDSQTQLALENSKLCEELGLPLSVTLLTSCDMTGVMPGMELRRWYLRELVPIGDHAGPPA